MTAHCTAGGGGAASFVHAVATTSAVRGRVKNERGMSVSSGVGWPSTLEQRRAQHLGVQVARVMRLPALDAGQPHVGGTEEQGVDLVEVAVVALENLVERRAVVLRRRGRDLRHELRELLVVGVYRVARPPAVQDAIVGAADGAQVVLRDRGERGGPDPRSEEHTSELQSQSNLVCRLLLEKKK